MSDKELLEVAIKDLVKLSTLANNVIIKGSFKGAVVDEVKEVLDMCKQIYNTFVERSEDE